MIDNKIIEVTVFPEMAMITRVIKGELSQGNNLLSFYNLPDDIQKDSVRVSIKSESSVKIESVDIIEEYLDSPEEANIKKLEQDLKELKRNLVSVESAIVSCSEKSILLSSVTEISFTRFMDEFYYRKKNYGYPGNLIEYYLSNSDKIDSEQVALKKEKKTLEKKILMRENQMAGMKSLSALEVITCTVSINSSGNGKCSLYLTYLTENAGWSPVYDARLSSEQDQIDLSYYGSITQHSGENWEDVKVYISGNMPSQSQSLPEMDTWFIGPDAGASIPNPAHSSGNESSGSMNATFSIGEKQDIPSDNTEKKVLLAREQFPVEIRYGTYPKAINSVFMTGKWVNSADFPILSGIVKVYHEQEYIGDSSIEAVIPGEETEISLGADDRIKVKRELLKHFTRKKGVTGGYIRTNYRYRISLESFRDNAVQVTVRENIPVSQNSEVKVSVEEVTGDIKPDHPGVFTWEKEIQPKEKKVILIEYYIEYPVNTTVTGLEA